MVNLYVTKWSPNHCGCTLNYEWDLDQPEPRDTKFLLAEEVCDDHAHLMSSTHKPEHAQLSNHVLDIIKAAQHRNITTAMARLDEPKIARSAKRTREMKQSIEMVKQFNIQVEEEWQELVSPPHAFDSHIYDIVLEENQRWNKAYGHIIDHAIENNNTEIFVVAPNGSPTLRDDRTYIGTFSGKAPNRVLHIDVLDNGKISVIPAGLLERIHSAEDMKNHGKVVIG